MVNWRKLSKDSKKEVENQYCVCREILDGDKILCYMLGVITFNDKDEWEINIYTGAVTIPFDINEFSPRHPDFFKFRKDIQIPGSEIQYVVLDKIF